MIDTTALLALPVNDRPQAEAFIAALRALNLGYHFDDGAVDCLHGNGLVPLDEAKEIDAKIDACYCAWRASGADLQHDCPIGYLLALDEVKP
jgi:hypothetical protein